MWPKQQLSIMQRSKISNYDLEERTFQFAKSVRELVRKLPKTVSTIEDSKQVVRASGSIGANYIEANESLSKRDFLMRLKISRKEAKECGYFLRLIKGTLDGEIEKETYILYQEVLELRKILSAIILKSN